MSGRSYKRVVGAVLLSNVTGGVGFRPVSVNDDQQVFNTPGQLSARIAGGGGLKARFVNDTFQDITNEAPQEAHFIVDLLASKPIGRRVELFVAGVRLAFWI